MPAVTGFEPRGRHWLADCTGCRSPFFSDDLNVAGLCRYCAYKEACCRGQRS